MVCFKIIPLWYCTDYNVSETHRWRQAEALMLPDYVYFGAMDYFRLGRAKDRPIPIRNGWKYKYRLTAYYEWEVCNDYNSVITIIKLLPDYL